jgi:predicted nicotinamide N-methyase
MYAIPLDCSWGRQCTIQATRNGNEDFDLIIAADVLYHPEHFTDLIQTIISSLGPQPRSKPRRIIICFEQRRRCNDDFIDQFKIALNEHYNASMTMIPSSSITIHHYDIKGSVDTFDKNDSEYPPHLIETEFYLYDFQYPQMHE